MADFPLRPDSVRAKADRASADSFRHNVITFRPRPAKASAPSYAAGVTPFDPRNPAHILAWNTIFALGWSEQRRIDREGE